MTLATVAAIAGVLVVLVALWIQVSKKEITVPGVLMVMVGFILITSQAWASIVIDTAGGKVELKQFAEATAAADDVAEQVEVLAGEVTAIKGQLIGLSARLQTGQPVSPDAAREIESKLTRMPTVDRSKLSSARITFGRVRPVIQQDLKK